jgi:hypothetical protein
MIDPPAWPAYDIGPHASVFALGVAAINYAKLEFAFSCVFAKVRQISTSQACEMFAKVRNNYKRLERMRGALQKINWPDNTKDRVIHLMECFNILVDNRNLLVHSSMFAGIESPTILYKSDGTGNTTHTVTSLTQLRQVADDMMH